MGLSELLWANLEEKPQNLVHRFFCVVSMYGKATNDPNVVKQHMKMLISSWINPCSYHMLKIDKCCHPCLFLISFCIMDFWHQYSLNIRLVHQMQRIIYVWKILLFGHFCLLILHSPYNTDIFVWYRKQWLKARTIVIGKLICWSLIMKSLLRYIILQTPCMCSLVLVLFWLTDNQRFEKLIL